MRAMLLIYVWIIDIGYDVFQVVHDIAEIAGLVAHSFGEEGVDRHVELWKKGILMRGRTCDYDVRIE